MRYTLADAAADGFDIDARPGPSRSEIAQERWAEAAEADWDRFAPDQSAEYYEEIEA